MGADLGWTTTAESLRSLDQVPAALANAWLLDHGRDKWGHVVAARSSMHDLLFTRQGDDYPFQRTVRVSWRDGVYTFELAVPAGQVSADRCFAPKASIVLDSFLYQLAGDAEPTG
jgi:hypothetical protein